MTATPPMVLRPKVAWILETHAHADHLAAVPHLQQHPGDAVAIGRHSARVHEAFGPARALCHAHTRPCAGLLGLCHRRRRIRRRHAVAAFAEMRNARNATLGMPVLTLPAIQVNMRAGHFPPPEDNGTRYPEIPLNVL